MKLKYYDKDDILVIKTSDEEYDYAEMADNVVVHYTKSGKPTRIEILEASKFFDKESKTLPKRIKEEFFTPA